MLGGEVGCTSEPGRGSCFFLELVCPVMPAEGNSSLDGRPAGRIRPSMDFSNREQALRTSLEMRAKQASWFAPAPATAPKAAPQQQQRYSRTEEAAADNAAGTAVGSAQRLLAERLAGRPYSVEARPHPAPKDESCLPPDLRHLC